MRDVRILPQPTPRWRRLAAIAGLALVCAWHGAPAAEHTSSELKAKRKALSAVKAHIRHVQHEIKASRQRESKLTRELRQAETRIGKLKRSEASLNTRINRQKQHIAQTRDKQQTLRARLAKSRQTLADQVRTAYLMGRQSRVKLLLSQQNPALVERVMIYYNYIMKARAKAISRINSQAQALSKTQAKLTSQLADLKQLHDQREQTLAHLKSVQSDRHQALAGLKSHLQSQSQKLASLKKDQAQLEHLIGSLRHALTHVPEPENNQKHPFRTLKGKLPWPLHGKTLARFGEGKNGGQLHWQGLWLAAPQGKPVHAVASGRVVYVGWMPSYGLLVIVDQGGGYYTLYAHDQSVIKQTGDSVRAGEEIATTGDSGGHRKSGVYFEIRKGKTPLDPSHWLRNR